MTNHLNSNQPLLEICDLSVWFRKKGQIIKAVDHVNLELHSGSTLGIVGESGSGKTTLAKAVLGLVPMHSGSIRLVGKEITNHSRKTKIELSRKMQAVFQDPNSSLDPYIPISQSLTEPLEVHRIKDRDELKRRVAEALDRVGLPPDTSFRYPAQFSGGQQQRIAIARALIVHPDLVICDEPVSYLDLSVQAQILNLLADLQKDQQLSYLFISHDISVINYISNQVAVMYRGQLLETGTTSAVINNPGHPYTRELIDSVPIPDPRVQRLRSAEEKYHKSTMLSSARAADTVISGCLFAPRCPYVIDLCYDKRPPQVNTENQGFSACHRFPEWKSLS
jgi:oligopeptide/dipeptide ABC transporter ATP-binding protein